MLVKVKISKYMSEMHAGFAYNPTSGLNRNSQNMVTVFVV